MRDTLAKQFMTRTEQRLGRLNAGQQVLFGLVVVLHLREDVRRPGASLPPGAAALHARVTAAAESVLQSGEQVQVAAGGGLDAVASEIVGLPSDESAPDFPEVEDYLSSLSALTAFMRDRDVRHLVRLADLALGGTLRSSVDRLAPANDRGVRSLDRSTYASAAESPAMTGAYAAVEQLIARLARADVNELGPDGIDELRRIVSAGCGKRTG